MARQDGGIGGDIVGDLLVGGQLDAAREGAKKFAGPLGTPADIASGLAGDLKSGWGDIATGLVGAGSSETSAAREYRLKISTLHNAERRLNDLVTVLDTVVTNLRTLVSETSIQETLEFSPATGNDLMTAARDAQTVTHDVLEGGKKLLPAFPAIIESAESADRGLSRGVSLVSQVGTKVGNFAWGVGKLQVRVSSRLIALPASTFVSAVGGATYVTAWRGSLLAAGGGIAAAGAGGIVTSLTRSFKNATGEIVHGILTDPQALDDPQDWLRSAAIVGKHFKQGLTAEAIEAGTGDFLPDDGPLSYQSIMTLLGSAWAVSGRAGTGIESFTPNREQRDRMAAGQEAFRSKLALEHPLLPQDFRNLTSVSDVLANAGEIDAMGRNEAAVIRVMVNHGPPHTITLIFPSTKDWYSSSDVPNDLASNILIMGGADSALLKAGENALRKTIKDLSINPASVSVMVAGFSQGGITAARFAQKNHGSFKIKQVVTAGAPIARIPLPAEVSILSFENAGDTVIPRLDLKKNRETKQHKTVHGDAGGHSALDYAETAQNKKKSYAKHGNVGMFLGGGGQRMSTHDHYVVRTKKQ